MRELGDFAVERAQVGADEIDERGDGARLDRHLLRLGARAQPVRDLALAAAPVDGERAELPHLD